VGVGVGVCGGMGVWVCGCGGCVGVLGGWVGGWVGVGVGVGGGMGVWVCGCGGCVWVCECVCVSVWVCGIFVMLASIMFIYENPAIHSSYAAGKALLPLMA